MTQEPAQANDEPIDYELIDVGDGRRLERFGGRLVDRPAAGARDRRRDPAAWAQPDLRWEAGRGWIGRSERPIGPWRLQYGGVELELRPTASGQLGIFPEHLAVVGSLAARASAMARPMALNLFAHTGLATLVLARSGATVTHVDAQRSVVGWARRNAELSGLASAPIRWIVDDATSFVEREARRGRRYDLILADPPSYGHGTRGGWGLERDLPRLAAAIAAVASPSALVVVTAHSADLAIDAIAAAHRAAFGGGRASIDELRLTARSGAALALGHATTIDLGDATIVAPAAVRTTP